MPGSSSWVRARLSGAPPLLHSLPSSTAAGRRVATVLDPMAAQTLEALFTRGLLRRRCSSGDPVATFCASPSRLISFFKPGHFTSNHINPQLPCTSSPGVSRIFQSSGSCVNGRLTRDQMNVCLLSLRFYLKLPLQVSSVISALFMHIRTHIHDLV